MQRIVLPLFVFGLWILLASASVAADSDVTRQPNVLFVSIDDLNDWVGFLNGHPQVKTPNMDRLAARGVVFTDAHCAAPICGPSRSAVMSGRQPYHTGLYTNASNIKALSAAIKRDPSIQTLPSCFRDNGYQTFGAGKLFHGGVPKNTFDDYGPNHSSGGRSGGPFAELSSPAQRPSNLVTHGDLKVMLPLNRMPDDRPWGSSNTFDWGPVDLPPEEFSDGKVTNWAIEKLKALSQQVPADGQSPKPFFLGVGFFRPHQPLFNPKRFHDMYPPDQVQLPPHLDPTLANDLSDIGFVGQEYATRSATSGNHATVARYGRWNEAVSSYLASVSFVDDLLGRILDTLDASPFANNTHIVLWSDHGFHLGEKQHWGKATGWQRATQVPLVIVPARNSVDGFQPGGRCDRPVNLLDIYPTLVEACALPKQESLDGTSLVPLLAKPDAEPQRTTVTTWARGNHSVYTSDWHLMHYFDGTKELYSRSTDANEWTNVAEKNPDVIKSLGELVPQNDDIRLCVRMGPWKAIFPKKGSVMGDEPLLFETLFENQVEERKAETKKFPQIMAHITGYLRTVRLSSKYVTIPDMPLADLKSRLAKGGVVIEGGAIENVKAWHAVRPSEGLVYKGTNANGSGAVFITLESRTKDVRLPRLNNPVVKAYLASDSERTPLDIRPMTDEWAVVLPKDCPVQDVIVLETSEAPHLPIVPQVVSPNADGVYDLKAHQALVYGKKLCYEPLPHKNTIGYWVHATDWAQWHLRVDTPGTFEIEILQGCGTGQGGSQVAVHLVPAYPTVAEFENPAANSETKFTVEDTGHFQKFTWRNIGTLTASRRGWYVLQLKPIKIAKNAVMDCRAMKLTRTP